MNDFFFFFQRDVWFWFRFFLSYCIGFMDDISPPPLSTHDLDLPHTLVIYLVQGAGIYD